MPNPKPVNEATDVAGIDGSPNSDKTNLGWVQPAQAPAEFPVALLFRGRAVLSAALLRGQILKALALAGILTLARMAPGLAIRLPFAGVDAVAGRSCLRALVGRIGGSHRRAVCECKKHSGGRESQA
jgi:hypothetical protein